MMLSSNLIKTTSIKQRHNDYNEDFSNKRNDKRNKPNRKQGRNNKRFGL